MKTLLALAVILSGLPLHAQFIESDGAKEAIKILPARFQAGIVKLSADNGTPNPPQWDFLVKNASEELFSVTISQGQVTSEKPSLNLKALLGNPSPINLDKLTVGSTGAWNAAQAYCNAKGKQLGSVSYALSQKGRDAAPLWAVWCYGTDGGYIGYLELLATTGGVVSSE